MVEPRIVARDPVTVVGIRARYDGDDSVRRRLRAEFDERWEEFRVFADSEGWYGVVTPDRRTDQFDYVVGVELGDTRPSPGDYAPVDVPGGRYVVFETTVESFESDYEAVAREWLDESLYERRSGPEFERFERAFDGDAAEGAYDYYVPVTATGED